MLYSTGISCSKSYDCKLRSSTEVDTSYRVYKGFHANLLNCETLGSVIGLIVWLVAWVYIPLDLQDLEKVLTI